MTEDQLAKPLPVVRSDNTPATGLSGRDLLRTHLRTDEEIRTPMLEQVLYERFYTGPSDVEVHCGTVTLLGVLERRRQARLTLHLTRHVDGVIDNFDRLGYRVNDTRRHDGHHGPVTRAG